MKEFSVGKFNIRLMNHNDLEEVKKVQILRYVFLLRDYDPSLPVGGIDNDGYDEVSESVLVIDKENGIIAGTYRIATPDTIGNHKYLTEDEYNIDDIKMSGERFLELGRAVVRPEYRNGSVLKLLFIGIYNYASEHNCRYLLGLCSFHGHDPAIYGHALALLKRDYSCKRFDIKATRNAFSFDYVEPNNIDLALAKEQMPNLLRMYLRLGHKVSMDGSIDYKFNSCDVFIILDINEIDIRYAKRLLNISVDESK